jgi:hypothetical protein
MGISSREKALTGLAWPLANPFGKCPSTRLFASGDTHFAKKSKRPPSGVSSSFFFAFCSAPQNQPHYQPEPRGIFASKLSQSSARSSADEPRHCKYRIGLAEIIPEGHGPGGCPSGRERLKHAASGYLVSYVEGHRGNMHAALSLARSKGEDRTSGDKLVDFPNWATYAIIPTIRCCGSHRCFR